MNTNKNIINNKNVIIIFANTLWFLEKFKFDLIKFLSNTYTVKCLYLREGPTLNQSKINDLKKIDVVFKQVNINFLLSCLISNVFFNCKGQMYNKDVKNIIVFTIGPILLSSFIFAKQIKSTIFILEGLGRIFSSRIIFYRVLKRIIQYIYKILFSQSKYVVTLNYSDARYLLEFGIVSINKLRTIPGTGINTTELDMALSTKPRKPKYIDYIARILPEKGFYLFVSLRQYLLNFDKKNSSNYIFRVIAPQSDIDKLSKDHLAFYHEIGIHFKPYISDTYYYYKESKVIILPTTYGEGLSRVVLEAVYLGIPLLVSRNPGTEEILPYDYKYFISSNNPFVLSAQLSRLINDLDYYKLISINQRILLRNYYSTDKSIHILSSFLE